MNEEKLAVRTLIIFRNSLSQIVDEINTELERLGQAMPQELNIPQLDISDIQELPWKTRGKTLASKSGYAWMFTHNDRDLKPQQQEIIDALCSAISTAKDGEVDLGEFIFKFSGRDNALLNRIPKKRESAR